MKSSNSIQLQPPTGSLRLLLATVFAISIPNVPQAHAAGLIETFSYADGPLTSVSGGAWQFWEPGAGNATVVNGAARFDGLTDLIRYYPAILTAPGQTATFSFTLNVAVANTTEAYEIALAPSSGFGGFNSTAYDNGLILQFDYKSAPAGMSSIEVAEGLGTGLGNTLVSLGFMTTGVTHAIDVTLARGATNTAYSLFLDNTLLRSATFVLSAAGGINALEIDQATSSPSVAGSALIDDIRIVPEPSFAWLLAAGGVWLMAQRRQSSPSGGA